MVRKNPLRRVFCCLRIAGGPLVEAQARPETSLPERSRLAFQLNPALALTGAFFTHRHDLFDQPL